MKLSKLITSSDHYQNARNMKADRLYFNNDVFSCVMVHLVHLHLDDETLSKKGISLITLILRMIT